MAGRPRLADSGALYAFAHQFYWDFRRILEGHVRWVRDDEEYRQLVAELDSQQIKLSKDQKLALVQSVRSDVREGRLAAEDKIPKLLERGRINLDVTREWLHSEASEVTRKQIQVPGMPEVVDALLRVETVEELRSICEGAFTVKNVEIAGAQKEIVVPSWPIPVGSVLPKYLSEFAAQFIAAKGDPRFPRSTQRPSSRWKQLWFLSRALAGALYGVSVRTSINLVGSKRPEESFNESRAGRRVRTRKN
jgi:hypothetical protein